MAVSSGVEVVRDGVLLISKRQRQAGTRSAHLGGGGADDDVSANGILLLSEANVGDRQVTGVHTSDALTRFRVVWCSSAWREINCSSHAEIKS